MVISMLVVAWVLRALTGTFTVTGPVFDPYVIDRVRDPYRRGKRNLGALCKHYGVRLDNAHEATADATAAASLRTAIHPARPREAWSSDASWDET